MTARKSNDLQKYILYYFSEKDDKYIAWFLHYYEHAVNNKVMAVVQDYAMVGHFADIKQAYITGMLKALRGLRSQPWHSFYRVQGICRYERGTRIYPYHADGLYRSGQ